MGNPRGVKRDFEALEDRRLKAAKLLKAGWSQADVAREVGVHRQSVSRWAAEVHGCSKIELALQEHCLMVIREIWSEIPVEHGSCHRLASEFALPAA